MRRSVFCLVLVLGFACKGREPVASDTTSTAATPANTATTTAATASEAPIPSAESAVAPEVNPPGDIPDSQAFVAYKGSGYTVDVPEGWARSENGAEVTFVDKLDGVKVAVAPAGGAPTASSAREREAADVQRRGRAVQITDVREVQLPGGPAVVIRYTSNSEPNAVTGKQVRLENETWLYFRNGREAAITLWAPKGADNVDQWTRMSKSFRWM